MLELTGMDSVLRGIGVLYWLLAFGAIGLAIWKGGTWKHKTLWAGVAIVAFGYLPAKSLVEHSQRQAYAREAWAYFKNKCETAAGMKIQKTFTGVTSVLVVKPLPPATEKDLYDQFWYGDPYSSTNAHERRAESAATILIGTLETRGLKVKTNAERVGFAFVESIIGDDKGASKSYVKYSLSPDKLQNVRIESIDKPVSRFGIVWEDISKPEDRKYWVAGSRLRVVDLLDNSVIAERTGFFIESGFGSTATQRRPWQSSRGPSTTCPSIESSFFQDRFFIHKVLEPGRGE